MKFKKKKGKLFLKDFEKVFAKTRKSLTQTVKVYLSKSGFSFHHSVLMDKHVSKVIDLEIII